MFGHSNTIIVMDIEECTRTELIALINDEYNEGRKRSYAVDFTSSLRPLPTVTLRSILRSIRKASIDPSIISVMHMFKRRATIEPDHMSRLAELFEAEFFSIHEALNATYNVSPDVIAKADAIAGVLVLEDEYGAFSGLQKHRLAMILGAMGWVGSLDTWELREGSYGNYSTITEDTLVSYARADHSDDEFDKLLRALCSDHGYSRFIEALDSIGPDNTEKALLSGIL